MYVYMYTHPKGD